AQTGYVRGAQFLIRKVGVALVVLAAFTVLAGGLGKTLPTSFMPQEDQGFFFMNVQLPEAASMQRTNAVMRKIDEIVKTEPGVHYVNAVSGYSLLSQTASPRNGLYFVQLKPYEERATRALQSDAIVASLNRKLAGLAEAQVVAFHPSAIPGLPHARGARRGAGSPTPSPRHPRRRPGRRRRRLHPGSRGQHGRLSLAEHEAVHGRAAEAARDRVPGDNVRARHSAALPGGRGG